MILNSLFLQNHVDADTASNLKNGKQKQQNYLFADIINLVSTQETEDGTASLIDKSANQKSVINSAPIGFHSKPEIQTAPVDTILKSFEDKLSTIVDRIIKEELPHSSSIFSQSELKGELKELLTKDFALADAANPDSDNAESKIEQVLKSILNLSNENNIVIVDDAASNTNLIHVEKLSDPSQKNADITAQSGLENDQYILKVYNYDKLLDAETELYSDYSPDDSKLDKLPAGFTRESSLKNYIAENTDSDFQSTKIDKTTALEMQPGSENTQEKSELRDAKKASPKNENQQNNEPAQHGSGLAYTVNPVWQSSEEIPKPQSEQLGTVKQKLTDVQPKVSENVEKVVHEKTAFSKIQTNVRQSFLPDEISLLDKSPGKSTVHSGNVDISGDQLPKSNLSAVKEKQSGTNGSVKIAEKFADIFPINTAAEEGADQKKITVETVSVKNGQKRHVEKPHSSAGVVKQKNENPKSVQIFAYKKFETSDSQQFNSLELDDSVLFRLDNGKAITKILGDLPRDRNARIERILSARADFLKPITEKTNPEQVQNSPSDATRFFEPELSEKLNSALWKTNHRSDLSVLKSGKNVVDNLLSRGGNRLDRIDNMLKNLSINPENPSPETSVSGEAKAKLSESSINEFYKDEFWGLSGKKSTQLAKMNLKQYKAFQNSYQSVNKIDDITKGLKYVAGELEGSSTKSNENTVQQMNSPESAMKSSDVKLNTELNPSNTMRDNRELKLNVETGKAFEQMQKVDNNFAEIENTEKTFKPVDAKPAAAKIEKPNETVAAEKLASSGSQKGKVVEKSAVQTNLENQKNSVRLNSKTEVEKLGSNAQPKTVQDILNPNERASTEIDTPKDTARVSTEPKNNPKSQPREIRTQSEEKISQVQKDNPENQKTELVRKEVDTHGKIPVGKSGSLQKQNLADVTKSTVSTQMQAGKLDNSEAQDFSDSQEFAGGGHNSGNDSASSSSESESGKHIFQNEFKAHVLSETGRQKDTLPEQKIIRVEEISKEIPKLVEKHDKQTVTMILDPKELGKVKLSLDLADKIVHARFEVENEAVRKAIESQFNQLNSNLHSSGLQVGSFNVALSSSDQKNLKNFDGKKKEKDAKAEELNSAEMNEESDSKSKMVGYNTYDYIA